MPLPPRQPPMVVRAFQAVKPILRKVWNTYRKVSGFKKSNSCPHGNPTTNESASADVSTAHSSHDSPTRSTPPSTPPTTPPANNSRELSEKTVEGRRTQETTDEHYWDAIDQIPDSVYVDLVVRHLRLDEVAARRVYITGRSSGGFNLVTFIRYRNVALAIKVPAAGWDGRWTSERAYLLHSEVETMRLIHKKTDGRFPVPKILDYDHTLSNHLGAPYIMMECLPGRSALEIWYDWQDYNGSWLYDVDYCPPEKVQLRENFLKSLAEKMSMLREIQSPQIGMLSTDEEGNLKIDQHIFIDLNTHSVTRRPVYDSSASLYQDRLREMAPEETDDPKIRAMYMIYEAILRSEPFTSSDEKEMFVLTHSDLNCQNILCNPETGEVTGIIDWEGASFLPRCVGYASLPLFLRDDWVCGFSVLDSEGNAGNNLSIDQLRHYRSVYSAAMKQTMGDTGDCRFTSKSMIYNAVHTTLFQDHNYYNGDFQDVVRKIIWNVLPYECYEQVCTALGKGWGFGERAVLPAIQKYMGPE